ncbi:MAG: DNA alkylation repair protein [Acidobacteria bacterium]|nr:DNA alkylation repair protein [Acidobacteriota bacterium]
MPSRRVDDVVAMLAGSRTQKDLDNLKRFGITAGNALGVSMANIQKVAKQVGRDHTLALALWKTGVYEARLLTAYVDEPDKVTAKQMDAWCRDFDNWGICDTLCFALFDRTPHAWGKVHQWCVDDREFVKRAGFALLASLAGHDKSAGNEAFLATLPLIEAGGEDGRHLVWKGVSWALRRMGRRNRALHEACVAAARRMAEGKAKAVGKEALRELTSAAVVKGLGK